MVRSFPAKIFLKLYIFLSHLPYKPAIENHQTTMTPTGTPLRNHLKLFYFFLLIPFSVTELNAQDYWDKIPSLTSQCYAENDGFGKKVEELRNEVKAKLEQRKRAVEEKASKMTNEEKMAIATRYQNMKPEDIVKMQNEMMEITQSQTAFQQVATEFETRFNQIEADFRTDFSTKLGPIDQEYKKLPDGEGTPQWAVKKGEELTQAYNKTYESICDKYFTSTDAAFKIWLKDFNTFLHEHEIPFNKKMMKMEYGQFGLTPDESVATLMAVEKYLEKCSAIFNLRKPYPQG